MSTNHKFTGGDTLTGLEKIIHNVLMQNELSNGNGAYKLSKAPGANSGFSFGGNQMDMSKNKAAREDFVKILKNSVDENNNKIFQFRDIKIILGKDSINITESGKTLNKTFNNYLPKINQALSSDYGKKVINEAYVRELEYGIEYCKKMVNNLKNPAAKEYYSDDKGFVKLFDYHNQFNIGHNSPLIHNYIDGSIKGKHKVHYGTKESQQAPTDEYTDIHHKEYLEGTKYYVDQENIIKNAKLKQAAAEKIDPVKAAASPVKIPVNDIDRRLDNIEDILSKHGVKQDEPKEVQLNDDNVDFNMVTEPSQPSVDVEKELSTIEEEVNKEPNEIERLIQEDMLTLKYSLDENLLKLELAILQVANSVEVSKEQSELVIGSVMRNMVEQLDWYKDKHFSKTGFDFGIKGIRERFIDPLALDLDNKGIQLTDENDPPVLFDLYGTGVKIKTQWLKPGSGWLVLDLNKNGVIDSGKEMFGDKTVLKNGELARNGFNALKEYDVNRDGVIDKRDPIFEELQIWQDFNQDGISQPEELFTLPELGIDSIKISNTWEGYVNNIYVHRNIFTKIDEKPNSSVGLTNYVINLNLSVTPFYREFTTKIELSEEAKNLPDMKGAGTLRDLREAMSLSPALAKVVTEYIHADTINKDRYLDKIILEWSKTSTFKSLQEQANEIYQPNGPYRFDYVLNWPSSAPEYKDFVEKIGVVEKLMGFTYGGTNTLRGKNTSLYYRDNSYIELNSEHTEAIKEAYEQFKLDIKLALLIGADLAPYIEAQLIDESLLFLKQSHAFTYLETAFKEALVENPNKGLNDFFNFSKLYGEHQTENKWDFNGFIKSQLTIQPELITTAAWHEQAKDVISQDVQEYAKLLSDNTLVEKTNELSIDDLILSLGHDSNAVESPMDFEAYSDETTYIDYQNIPYYLEDLKTQEVLI